MESETDGKAGRTAHHESARRALHAYRERRRQRRGEDTFFGGREGLFPVAAAGQNEPERERRRCELLDEADAVGMSRDLAERLYAVASEEGLDPALGFELVRSGLGICPPEEGITNAPAEPSYDKYLPDWMFPPIPPDDLLRERKLRLSFRRLRSLLEAHPEIENAFRAFAEEPDVEHCGY